MVMVFVLVELFQQLKSLLYDANPIDDFVPFHIRFYNHNYVEYVLNIYIYWEPKEGFQPK